MYDNVYFKLNKSSIYDTIYFKINKSSIYDTVYLEIFISALKTENIRHTPLKMVYMFKKDKKMQIENSLTNKHTRSRQLS